MLVERFQIHRHHQCYEFSIDEWFARGGGDHFERFQFNAIPLAHTFVIFVLAKEQKRLARALSLAFNLIFKRLNGAIEFKFTITGRRAIGCCWRRKRWRCPFGVSANVACVPRRNRMRIFQTTHCRWRGRVVAMYCGVAIATNRVHLVSAAARELPCSFESAEHRAQVGFRSRRCA